METLKRHHSSQMHMECTQWEENTVLPYAQSSLFYIQKLSHTLTHSSRQLSFIPTQTHVHTSPVKVPAPFLLHSNVRLSLSSCAR